MSLYTETTTAELTATQSVYSLIVEALTNDVLAKSDAELRDAVTALVVEFDGYNQDAIGELVARKRGYARVGS